MDNAIPPPPPPPPPPAGEANEAPADGLKKPWHKPSVRILNRRLDLVSQKVLNVFVGETPTSHGVSGYKPS